MGEVFGHEDAEMRPSTITLSKYKKEPIKVTLPITMTEDDVKRFNADTSKGVYDDEHKVWQFYDATYRVTNDVTFGVPQEACELKKNEMLYIMYSISFYIIKIVPSVRMALLDDRENLN